jgi:hypothetical protein
MSDEPRPGYNASPVPSVGSTGVIGALVAGFAPGGDVVEVVDTVDVDTVDVVGVGRSTDGGVDAVGGRESTRRPSPLGDPDEHDAANPTPTSRIAATRSEPARRTARTVPGDVGPVVASGLLDDS